MSESKTTERSEKKDEFIGRRTKEILGLESVHSDWSMIPGKEKLVAVLQAEREWLDVRRKN